MRYRNVAHNKTVICHLYYIACCKEGGRHIINYVIFFNLSCDNIEIFMYLCRLVHYLDERIWQAKKKERSCLRLFGRLRTIGVTSSKTIRR